MSIGCPVCYEGGAQIAMHRGRHPHSVCASCVIGEALRNVEQLERLGRGFFRCPLCRAVSKLDLGSRVGKALVAQLSRRQGEILGARIQRAIGERLQLGRVSTPRLLVRLVAPVVGAAGLICLGVFCGHLVSLRISQVAGTAITALSILHANLAGLRVQEMWGVVF